MTRKRFKEQGDLGVLITRKFQEYLYRHDQVSKSNKMLGFIRRNIARGERLLSTMKPLFVALVRSHLETARLRYLKPQVYHPNQVN